MASASAQNGAVNVAGGPGPSACLVGSTNTDSGQCEGPAVPDVRPLPEFVTTGGRCLVSPSGIGPWCSVVVGPGIARPAHARTVDGALDAGIGTRV